MTFNLFRCRRNEGNKKRLKEKKKKKKNNEPIVFLVRGFGTRKRVRSLFVRELVRRKGGASARQLATKSQYRTSSVARGRIILKSLWFALASTTTATPDDDAVRRRK